MITDRDKTVIDFIKDFKVATTDTIAELFYPNLTIARRRLRTLTNEKALKRDRCNHTMQYYYYISKPRQLRHSLLITDFYRELNKICNIEFFENEFICENVRSDGLAVYQYKNEYYVAFIEVQIANTPLDVKKYEKLYRSAVYKNYFGEVFPFIIAITDRKIPDTMLKIIKINENLSNLKEVLDANRQI